MIDLVDISILDGVQDIITEEYNRIKEFLPSNSPEIRRAGYLANILFNIIKKNTRQSPIDLNSVASYSFEIPSPTTEESFDYNLDSKVREKIRKAGDLSTEFIYKWKSMSESVKAEPTEDSAQSPQKSKIDLLKEHSNFIIYAKNEMMRLSSIVENTERLEMRAAERDKVFTKKILALLS